MNPDENDRRFSLLEVDDNEAPAAAPADETALVVEVESAPAPLPVVESPDPIDAFRDRVRAERDERTAAERRAAEKLAAERAESERKRRELAANRAQIWTVERADESTGAVVFWQVGGTVDLGRLAENLRAEGLDDRFIPKGCSTTVALTRAVTELRSRDVLVRQHPTEDGWALLPRQEGEKLAFAECARFFLDGDEIKFEGVVSDDDVKLVRETFAQCHGQLLVSDITKWLTDLFADHAIKAVAMKDNGGLYFVPRPELATFGKVKRALCEAASSCKLYEMPAFKATDAVSAALDGIAHEAQAAIAKLEIELAAPEGVGARAARNRVNEITVILDKVRGYEILLGRSFEDVIAKLEALSVRFDRATDRAANLEVD